MATPTQFREYNFMLINFKAELIEIYPSISFFQTYLAAKVLTKRIVGLGCSTWNPSLAAQLKISILKEISSRMVIIHIWLKYCWLYWH